MGTHPIFESDFDCLTKKVSKGEKKKKMPKVRRERNKLHHSSKEDDDVMSELGIAFKMPPPVSGAEKIELPRLTTNPFTGESIENDDVMSMASSRMSSRSSASRLGRDGDSQSVTKKKRRNARRQFLLDRLNLSKQNDEDQKAFEKKVEQGGKAATIDELMSSLPTQSQMLIEDVKKQTKKKIINHEKLTEKDCRNTRTKRANRIIQQELIDFKNKVEKRDTKLSLMDQLAMMKDKVKGNIEKQNKMLEESAKVVE